MIYTADYIVTMDGPILKNGGIEVRGNRILKVLTSEAVQNQESQDIRKFSDTILMPGLINCHAHLELGWSRGMFPKHEVFSMWVSRLQKAQESLTDENIKDSVRLGLLECIKTGTTTIADISNSPFPLQILSENVIRSFPYQELLGLDPQIGMKNFKLKSKGLELFNNREKKPEYCNPSLAIHAPFSCSRELIEAVIKTHSPADPPFTMHLGESKDEWDLFTNSSGRLLELCKKKYPDLKLFNQPPIEYMIENDLLPENSLLAHCNYLDSKSADFFADRNISIVHCPRSREFFGHKEFPYELCHNKEINVCLGTDSLGSNDDLSMFEEMSQFKADFPQVECLQILQMATLNGARALNRENELGKLKKDFLADIIGINLKHDEAFDIPDEIVSEEFDVNFVLIDGKEVMI